MVYAPCFVKPEMSGAHRQKWHWITTWMDIWHHNSPLPNTHYFPLIRGQLLGFEATLRRPWWISPEKPFLWASVSWSHIAGGERMTLVKWIYLDVCVFLSDSAACSDNSPCDSDFEGGWSDPRGRWMTPHLALPREIWKTQGGTGPCAPLHLTAPWKPGSPNDWNGCVNLTPSSLHPTGTQEKPLQEGGLLGLRGVVPTVHLSVTLSVLVYKSSHHSFQECNPVKKWHKQIHHRSDKWES